MSFHTIRMFPVCAALAALGALTTPAMANTTSGMIDGNYARQLPAYHLRSSTGYTRICIQITGSGSTATGTIKARTHGGTWETLLTSPALTLNRGARGNLTNMFEGQTLNQRFNPRLPGGNENCMWESPGRTRTIFGVEVDLADWGTRPTNWCGTNRTFDQNGWEGSLTQGNRLRVAVNNHVLKMQGKYPMDHGSTCP